MIKPYKAINSFIVNCGWRAMTISEKQSSHAEMISDGTFNFILTLNHAP